MMRIYAAKRIDEGEDTISEVSSLENKEGNNEEEGDSETTIVTPSTDKGSGTRSGGPGGTMGEEPGISDAALSLIKVEHLDFSNLKDLGLKADDTDGPCRDDGVKQCKDDRLWTTVTITNKLYVVKVEEEEEKE